MADAAREQAGSGTLFWIFSSVDYADYDGYTVYSGGEGASKPIDTPNTAQEAELKEVRKKFRNQARVKTCQKQLQTADDQGRIKDAFERISGGARVMSTEGKTSHDGVLEVIRAAAKMVNDP